jgi:ketosteroid isomerase-like protein
VTEFVSTEIEPDVALRRLLDESDIRAVLARYARAVDRNDMELLRTCYHPDATDAHGHVNGSLDEFIAYSERYIEQMDSMTHFYGQSTIELDGDSAWVESYCLCFIRMPGDDGRPMDRFANIRYVDLFERRDGAWRIARRKLVHQPGRLDPVEIDPQLAELAMRARMDAADPSYDRRPESFLP